MSRPALAYVSAIAAASLAILEVGKLNLALPALRASLDASDAALQSVLALYALGFGLSLVPFGRLGDAWSRRRVLVIGVALVGITSAASAVAPSAEMLGALRFFEGIAAGLIVPQATGVMQDLFSGRALSRAYGGFGAIVGTSALAAPTIGALFLTFLGDDLGWRAMMLANVPVCVVLATAAAIFIPENADRGKRLSPDPVGLLLLGIGISLVLAPTLSNPAEPATSMIGWALALVGCAVLVGFLAWERDYETRGKTPILSTTLLRNPSFRSGALIGALFFVAMPGTHLVLGLFLQEYAGMSPLDVALVLIFASLASIGSAWFGSRLSFRFGRRVIVVGLSLVALGLSATTAVCVLAGDVPAAVPAIAATQALVGFGGGLVTAPNQSVSMSTVSRSESSLAGSVFQLGQRLGTALGTSAVLYLYFHAETIAGGLASAARALVPTAVLTTAFLLIALVISVRDSRRPRPV